MKKLFGKSLARIAAIIAILASIMATASTAHACTIWIGQPKMPAKLQKADEE